MVIAQGPKRCCGRRYMCNSGPNSVYCSLPSSVSFSQIDGIPDTVLQGEVVKATMTIRNYGRAPAGSIYLRSNMPWVYVGEVRSKRSNLHTHHEI